MKRALGALLALFVSSGCAAYPGDLLPKRSVESLEKSRVTSIDYEIAALSAIAPDPWLVDAFPEQLDRQLEVVFSQADPGIGRAPLHLIVSFDAVRYDGPFLLSLVSGLTLFLIPSYTPVEFTLRAEARLNGAPVGSYSYTDNMEAWVGWIYLPKLFDSSYSRRTVAGVVMDTMIANLMFDLARDTASAK